MKKSLLAAIVALPALFALPAGAAADSNFTIVFKPAPVAQWHPAHARPAPRFAGRAAVAPWRHRPGRFQPGRRFVPRFGHRVVRPFRPYRPYRPYRFVYRFN